MSGTIVFSSEAIEDLKQIYDYIALHGGEDIASAYVGQIHRYCMGFDLFPLRGTRKDDLEPGLRIVGFKKRASIAFHVHGDVVTIVRIYNRGRNISAE